MRLLQDMAAAPAAAPATAPAAVGEQAWLVQAAQAPPVWVALQVHREGLREPPPSASRGPTERYLGAVAAASARARTAR